MMKRLISAVCVLSMFTANVAYSDITMNIWDDGVNLYMSATGSYDLSNATFLGTIGLGANAAVAPTYPIYGWETGSSNYYAASYGGTLTGTSDVFPANSTTTTNAFFFWGNANAIAMSGGLTGSVNEFAVFNGYTLALLGMVPGESINVSWGTGGVNERATISTGAVPEPGSILICGLLGLVGLVRGRRRSQLV